MWLSIQGIYEYDPTVFDGFDSPTYTDEDNVLHTLNRDDVINNILLQCAELEVIYPSPEMMKFAIGVWSASNIDAWNRLYESQLIKYNPIWNVDANISQTREDDRTINRDRDGTNQNINTVSGFNSESWSNADKDDGSYTDNEDLTESYSQTFTERRTGNIGVTATQDLIRKSREIADFSIIEYITQSFKERFCLLVY